MNRTRIAITTNSFADTSATHHRALLDLGLEIVFNSLGRRLTAAEHIGILRGCVGVIAGTSPLTREVIESSPDLRVISRAGTGLDSVDMETVRERGIELSITPGGPTLAVAELTVGLILSTLRRVAEADRNIRNGKWKALMGWTLKGKTVGLLGFGRVAQQVARFLKPFDIRLMTCDLLPPSEHVIAGLEVDAVCLEKLLSRADIVSIHLPKTAETRNMLSAERIRSMKAGAILINTSRGGIVDEGALREALLSGRLAGAALDVFEEEPYAGPLLDVPTVTLSAHMGSYAEEARELMETEAVANLIAGLRKTKAIP